MNFQVLNQEELRNNQGGFLLFGIAVYHAGAYIYEGVTGEDVPTIDDLADLF